MSVTVQKLTGKGIEISLSNVNNFKAFKEAVQDEEGVPINQQTYFKGFTYDEADADNGSGGYSYAGENILCGYERSLEEVGIADGDTVLLVLSLSSKKQEDVDENFPLSEEVIATLGNKKKESSDDGETGAASDGKKKQCCLVM